MRLRQIILGNSLQRVNLNSMLKRFGLNFEGREHSGLDDSKNIARVVIKMLNDHVALRVRYL